MKKIITTIIFSLMSVVSFADSHSGKIDLKGFFQADAKFLFDDKGIVNAGNTVATTDSVLRSKSGRTTNSGFG